jgi:hypothetical protein
MYISHTKLIQIQSRLIISKHRQTYLISQVTKMDSKSFLKRDFVKTDHTSSNPKRKKILATGDGLNVEYFIHLSQCTQRTSISLPDQLKSDTFYQKVKLIRHF